MRSEFGIGYGINICPQTWTGNLKYDISIFKKTCIFNLVVSRTEVKQLYFIFHFQWKELNNFQSYLYFQWKESPPPTNIPTPPPAPEPPLGGTRVISRHVKMSSGVIATSIFSLIDKRDYKAFLWIAQFSTNKYDKWKSLIDITFG